MSAISDAAAEPIALARPDLPQLRVIVVRAMLSLTMAVVAPTALFAATVVTFDVTAAVTVALSWVVGATFWRWATGRQVSGLLMLTLGIMTVRTGFTLATGNTFAYFVQPVATDAAVAAIFLGSLLTAKPIVARLAPDFYPIDVAIAARPGIRRLFRRLTLMWGLVIVVKATVTLSLLLALSTVHYVLLQSSTIIALMLTATAATVIVSTKVGRQEGLLRPVT